jgi:single-stranded DNA-binding protein
MSIYNNQITVTGNVGREAELREVGETGTVASFPLAVYRSGKGEKATTDWFKITAWHDLARGASTLRKGDRVIVMGQMKADVKENPDGSKITYYSILAREIGLDISVQKEATGKDEPF